MLGFIWLAWQGFGSGDSTGVASLRSCEELPLPSGDNDTRLQPQSATEVTDLKKEKNAAQL